MANNRAVRRQLKEKKVIRKIFNYQENLKNIFEKLLSS